MDNKGFDKTMDKNTTNGCTDENENCPKFQIDNIKPGSKNDPYRLYRFTKQTCIIGIWIAIGLYGGIIGPTLPDLRDSLGVGADDITAALMSKTVGLLIGSLTAGFLFNIFHKHADLLMFFGVVLMATISIAPQGKTLGFVCLFFWTAGFGEGVVNVGGNPMVMHLWQENAATPLMLTHFGYGLGAIISPQIAKPFLSSDSSADVTNTTTISYPISSNDYRKWYMIAQLRWEYGSRSSSINNSNINDYRITICYGIVGVLILCIAFCQLYFVIRGVPKGFKRWEPETPMKEMASPGSCAQGNKMFGLQMLLCLFLYFGFISGGQSSYVDFLYSYATESDLDFSNDEATSINSAFFLCYTVGRLFGGIIARFIPVQAILATVLGFTMAEVTILAIFAEQNEVIFWTFTCFFGFSCTMLFPCGMAWSNIYLYMNSMSSMVLLMGLSFIRIPFQYAAGYVYENYDPNYIFHVSGIAYLCVILVFTVMQIIGSCHGSKSDLERKKEGSTDLVVTVTDEKMFNDVSLSYNMSDENVSTYL